MKASRISVLASAIALLLMLAPGVVRADIVNVTFKAVDSSSTIHFNVTAFGGNIDESVYVGAYRWNVNTGDVPTAVGGVFHTFCIDFSQDISFNGVYNYDTSTPLASDPRPIAPHNIAGNPVTGMGVEKAEAIEELYGLHFAELGSDADKIAGFQMAIWEIIYEDQSNQLGSLAQTTLDVSAGPYFRETNADVAAIADANNDLASLFNGTNPATRTLRTDKLASLVALTSDVSQDQLIMVPLPRAATAGLSLLGLIAGASVLRRKSKFE